MGITRASFAFAALTMLAGACSSQKSTASPTHAQSHAVPAGSQLTVRLNDEIGIHKSSPGQFFTAAVAAPVRAPDGTVAIHEGALVRGRVVSVEEGRTPSIRLSFQSVDSDRGPVPIWVTVRKTSLPGLVSAKEIHETNLPYNAVLYPARPNQAQAGRGIGGGPGETTPRVQLDLPPGSSLRLVLTQAFTPPAPAGKK
jgi:hypothetical protein